MFKPFIDLIAGATYPIRALFFILKRPLLSTYIIIPILVNITVGATLYFFTLRPSLNFAKSIIANFSNKFDTWIANLPTWLNFLSFFDNIIGNIALTILVIFLSIIIGFILVQFGVILGAPWYGALSEKLEKARLGELPPALPFTLENMVAEITRSLGFELRKIQLLISFGLPTLLLNFIPVLGSILSVISWSSIMSTIVGLDFINAPLDRRRLSFKEKLSIFSQNLPASGTFGLVCLGLVSIPLLNLLVIPLCVAGGTLFFCDRIWPTNFADEEREKINQ